MGDSHHAPASGIARFWEWWATQRDAIAGSIEAGASLDWADAVSERVAAIHPRIDWEMGKGHQSRHALCLSGMGDPELRLIAEQWYHQAPEPDPSWEYHPTRIALPDPTVVVLALGETRVPFRDLRVGLQEDDARECLHVEVFHPAFEGLPEQARRQVAFLILDNTLGEDGVERWLGSIRLVQHPPDGAVDLPGLRERVRALTERATGTCYARLSDRADDGRPLEVVANLALKRWDHPRFHAHGEVEIPFTSDDDGMPLDDEEVQLDHLEAGLISALGDAAVFAGREQGLGRRVVHLYTREDGPVPRALQRWAADAPRAVEIRWSRDPSWRTWRQW